MTAPGFAASDAERLLADVLGDPTLIADRLTDWITGHVNSPRAAFVLLYTVAVAVAVAVADATDVRPGPGQMARVRMYRRDDPAAELPWRAQVTRQLLGTALNGDLDTLAAVVQSAVSQGVEPFCEVLASVLLVYRRLAQMRGAA